MRIPMRSGGCMACGFGIVLHPVRPATVEDYVSMMGWGSEDFHWSVVAETLRDLHIGFFRCSRCSATLVYMDDVGGGSSQPTHSSLRLVAQ